MLCYALLLLLHPLHSATSYHIHICQLLHGAKATSLFSIRKYWVGIILRGPPHCLLAIPIHIPSIVLVLSLSRLNVLLVCALSPFLNPISSSALLCYVCICKMALSIIFLPPTTSPTHIWDCFCSPDPCSLVDCNKNMCI